MKLTFELTVCKPTSFHEWTAEDQASYVPPAYMDSEQYAICTEYLRRCFALPMPLPETIEVEFHSHKVANSLRLESFSDCWDEIRVKIGRRREELDTFDWLNYVLAKFPNGVAWLRVMV